MAEPLWLQIARRELGQSEIAGEADNPRIVEYLRAVDLPGARKDEVSWCSAFVNWCIQQCGWVGTGSAAAKSWLQWGQACEPRLGAIVVMDRGTEAWQGHVGFYLDTVVGYVVVLGGNQSNSVSIAKYPIDKVRGYRWPGRVL